MTQLVELDPVKHGNLKIKPNCALQVAKNQHAIGLRVNELSKASCNFPIFFSRMDETGDWSLSAITSYHVGSNLFIQKGAWHATYFPASMQTYPIFLMNKPSAEKNYTFGIVEENPAFSQDEGEPLFDDKGNASIYLSRTKALLENGINGTAHTFQFLEAIKQHDLFKALDLQVQYVDGTLSTIKGLHTVDEEKLASLKADDYLTLREKGYLPAIYAMLTSLYQLNALLLIHNNVEGSTKIQQVKMEVSKD